jgi:hypothetical protein
VRALNVSPAIAPGTWAFDNLGQLHQSVGAQ